MNTLKQAPIAMRTFAHATCYNSTTAAKWRTVLLLCCAIATAAVAQQPPAADSLSSPQSTSSAPVTAQPPAVTTNAPAAAQPAPPPDQQLAADGLPITQLTNPPSSGPPLPPGCQRRFLPPPPVQGNFNDFLNTTRSVSPNRADADVPVGAWIEGRATFYGADARLDASRVACGEPRDQFGFIESGSCGYTNSDLSLPFPREMFAAAADTNEDYAGSCGRCYQIRCVTGSPQNNGRPLRVSDLDVNRGVYLIQDNQGRDWPGNTSRREDSVFTQCWNEIDVITVRIGDSCPCEYFIRSTGETRIQPWCCGGNNHFDISFWAFERLAHPSFGVMKMEYRPVDCETNEPVKSIPGFVSQTIFDDTIRPGWSWNPYTASYYALLAEGQGVAGSVATCATLSQDGAVSFFCRRCSQPGYLPFAKAAALQFDIRSNTKSSEQFASSTPRGEVPPLKLFMMNGENSTYCGAEVVLSNQTPFATKLDDSDWYRVRIPLAAWACQQGSVGSLAAVDRVDFQNVEVRDADVCLDNIALV